ncbi:MAG: hypothetical protein COS87_02405 [Chloroflexi bacterium CG07_land_8_20_14_0_80_45_17]|nr:MAG: hypothetical protein COX14_05250 [Chloroflexi bacterium CG23_combo_of_CG06-09_8_20_14_all_45_10]PIU56367.1 MAG: hypothetical protein COS87_02405 [Chloroflexi bacterium CG07_land_8_20_14_0_80_45_17]
MNQIAEQALVAPARCCLRDVIQAGFSGEITGQVAEREQVSSVEEGVIEKAFAFLPELSHILRDKYGL